jgi:hypothetical protein
MNNLKSTCLLVDKVMIAHSHMHMSLSSCYRGFMYETKSCTVLFYVALQCWKCDWNPRRIIKILTTIQLYALTIVISIYAVTCSVVTQLRLKIATFLAKYKIMILLFINKDNGLCLHYLYNYVVCLGTFMTI